MTNPPGGGRLCKAAKITAVSQSLDQLLSGKDVSLTTITAMSTPPKAMRVNRFPDPQEHAVAILEAVKGNYQIALDCMELYRQEYGDRYARRLAALLTPAGEC